MKKHYTGSKAKVLSLLIQMAILLKVILSTIKRVLSKMILSLFPESNKKKDERQQTVVVANEESFSILNEFLVNTGIKKNILGRIDTTTSSDANSLGCIDELDILINRYSIKEIIFCENGLNFKEIISIIQKLPDKVSKKIHAYGSSGLIGSDNKDRSGECIIVR